MGKKMVIDQHRNNVAQACCRMANQFKDSAPTESFRFMLRAKNVLGEEFVANNEVVTLFLEAAEGVIKRADIIPSQQQQEDKTVVARTKFPVIGMCFRLRFSKPTKPPPQLTFLRLLFFRLFFCLFVFFSSEPLCDVYRLLKDDKNLNRIRVEATKTMVPLQELGIMERILLQDQHLNNGQMWGLLPRVQMLLR